MMTTRLIVEANRTRSGNETTDAWKDAQHPAGVLAKRQMPDGTWQAWTRTWAFPGSVICGWYPVRYSGVFPIVSYADTWAEPMWPWVICPGDNAR